ncbi:MAG TPA: UDP-N-acetylmuramate--L-alanine ligase [Acidobacteriota bacterium]|jgi:UDP-N-acetylmuramate--alanine ligase
MLEKKSHVHFVGIGGIGMSGLALLLADMGHQVSGSDLKSSPQVQQLTARGARVSLGAHRAENVENPDFVVISSAVGADNPEVKEARRRGISVIHRGDLLARLMNEKRGIGIAGSHGKTTTTAMISMILLDAGLDPTCLVGGSVVQIGSNARIGRGEYLVAETDESDRSFLKLRPRCAVITNIDLEHMGAYRDEEDLVQAFADFAGAADAGGCVVCIDDERTTRILPRIKGQPVTYGWTRGADICAPNAFMDFVRGSNFPVIIGGKLWRQVRLPVPGIHNVLNSLAAVAVARLIGVDDDLIVESLSRFRGVARRMEKKGEAGGVWFYDDYGHHPTEIRATLWAAKDSRRRLVVLFQPHRYTRTRDAFDAFLGCFKDADQLFVTDIYAASEPPIEGVTGERLVSAITGAGHGGATFVPDTEVEQRVAAALREGDLFITIGAGDVYRFGERILQRRKDEYGN